MDSIVESEYMKIHIFNSRGTVQPAKVFFPTL